VRRLNAIEAKLATLDWSKAPVFEINGLKREELIAANSMILHEVYFDGLGGSGDPSGELAAALERDFGSLSRWHAEFTGMGKALAGGSGWVLLTWSDLHGRLANAWAADHTHCLVGGQPVLALDMYEHSYHLDFGAKAAAYVDAFMKNIHWERVAARYARVAHTRAPSAGAPAPQSIAAEELRARLERGEDIVVLDVCLADDLAKRSDMLPGAQVRAPEAVNSWAKELPRDKPIVAYCVYGFQVSGDAVAELRRRGLNAQNLAGGIAAWHAIAGPTVPLARQGRPQ
ncbi:MAG TPA: Fe-Mn family superoxide dismutase, partial [Dongiaceae bacterium]